MTGKTKQIKHQKNQSKAVESILRIENEILIQVVVGWKGFLLSWDQGQADCCIDAQELLSTEDPSLLIADECRETKAGFEKVGKRHSYLSRNRIEIGGERE